MLHHIPNPDVMGALFNNWDHKEVQRLTLPIGMPLNDGKLISTSNGTVYLFANGVKYWISNPETMNACNFNWNNI